MSLWNTLGVGFALADASTAIIAACPRFAEIVGRERADVLGLTMEETTHPDDIRTNRWLLDQSLELSEGFCLKKRYLRADRKVQWVENRVLSFGRSNAAPAFLIASRPIADPRPQDLEGFSADDYAAYAVDIAEQLAAMAGACSLNASADLFRTATVTLTMEHRQKSGVSPAPSRDGKPPWDSAQPRS